MEMMGKIRRMYFRDKLSLHQIAKRTDGGQLTAFIRSWRGEQGKSLRTFVPLTFALGEAFQFDWSEEGLLISGLFRRIQVST